MDPKCPAFTQIASLKEFRIGPSTCTIVAVLSISKISYMSMSPSSGIRTCSLTCSVGGRRTHWAAEQGALVASTHGIQFFFILKDSYTDIKAYF